MSVWEPNRLGAAARLTLTPVPQIKSTKEDLFPNNHYLGVRVLHKPPNPAVDIVFIHGITGHPYKTFATHGGVFWPTQLLAKDVTNARILSFGYDADVIKFLGPVGQNDIREHAVTLMSDIASVRSEYAEATRPIILVVHSLGGLVAKKALYLSEQAAEDHEKQLHRCTKAVAFLGTPHRGSDLATFAGGLTRILKASYARVNVDIVKLLQRNSEVLADIEATFGIWLRKNQSRFKLTCFFEEKEVIGVGLVVTKESAKISGFPQLPIPANHMDLVRFGSAEETGYRRVLGELRRWLRQEIDGEKIPENHKLQPANLVFDIEVLETLGVVTSIQSLAVQGCMVSLAFPEMYERGADIEIAAENTCQWILDHPTYQQWHANGQGLLWVKGKPGSGKSTLMKYIVRNAKDIHPDGRNLKISFYFHGRGAELQKSPLGLYRALTRQIGRAYPRTINTLVRKYEDMEGLLTAWSWRAQDLEDAIISDILPALLKISGLTIFIDALDECGEREARQLVRFLTRAHDRSASSPHRLSICFSCRHYPIIAPETCEQIVVEAANGEDVSKYINQELTRVFSDPKELETLRLEVEQRARHVFLWVILVIPQIIWMNNEGKPICDIIHSIRQIPTELHSLYENLIQQLTERSPERSKQLFQWICFGAHNLDLTHLRVALNFGFTDGDGDGDGNQLANQADRSFTSSLDEFIQTDDQMKKRLRVWSAGLAELSQKNRVQLIHQTVQDFLFDRGFAMLDGLDRAPLQKLIGEGHSRLTKSCLFYLVHWDKSEGHQIASVPAGQLHRIMIEQHKRYELLAYASHRWFQHAADADAAGHDQSYICDILNDRQSTAMASWSRLYVAKSRSKRAGGFQGDDRTGSCIVPKSDSTLLHEAIKYKIESLAETLINVPSNLRVPDYRGRTPLVYAVSECRVSLVHLIIHHPDTNINGDLTDGTTQFTAFQLALAAGHESVAKMIFQQSDFNLRLHWSLGETVEATSGMYPIMLTNEWVDDVLDLIISGGMNEMFGLVMRQWDRSLPLDAIRKLKAALRFQQADMVIHLIRLLSPEEVHSVKTNQEESVLHDAVQSGFEAGIRHLLSMQIVNPDLRRGSAARTPLHEAIHQRKNAIVKVLLEEGAGSNRTDALGHTPLISALKAGFSDAVTVLLADPNVDPNLKSSEITPLEYAIRLGDSKSLALILKRHDIDLPEFRFRENNDNGHDDGLVGINRGRSLLWVAINAAQNSCARVILNTYKKHPVPKEIRDSCGNLPSYVGVDDDIIEAVEQLHPANRWTPSDGIFSICWPEEQSDLQNYIGLDGMLDGNGNSLLSWTILQGWTEETARLLDMYHTWSDDGDDVWKVSAKSARINTPNHQGMTPLMLALERHHQETARKIYEMFQQIINYRSEDHKGLSLTHYAELVDDRSLGLGIKQSIGKRWLTRQAAIIKDEEPPDSVWMEPSNTTNSVETVVCNTAEAPETVVLEKRLGEYRFVVYKAGLGRK